MKSIFSDPLHWSKSVVGSKWRFGLNFGIHLFVCGMMAVALWDQNSATLLLGLFFVGMFFPFLYLYALRRLVMLFEDKNSRN